MQTQFNVHEAKTRLSQLIEQVEAAFINAISAH